MIIRYVPGIPSITLDEPEDFARFSVDAAGATRLALDAALRASGAGVLAGEGALVLISYLKVAARDLATDDAWLSALGGMVAFASSKGWLSSDERSIQAHIVNLAAA